MQNLNKFLIRFVLSVVFEGKSYLAQFVRLSAFRLIRPARQSRTRLILKSKLIKVMVM